MKLVLGALLATSVALGGCVITNNAAVCGDGVVDTGEACDDGNTVSGDGCSATCQIEVAAPVCGNHVVENGETCDDGNVVSGDGCSATCQTEPPKHRVTAHWALKTFAGAAVNCPPGFDTAAVINQEIDAVGTPIGNPFTDLFTCADGTGVTSDLPPGTYQTWVAITDHAGASTYAISVLAIVDLTTADKTYTADILTDGGYFGLAWTLSGKTSGSALTCTQAAADTVEVIATVSGGSQFTNDKFTCADGAGITAEFPTGSYTISVDTTLGNGGTLGMSTTLTSRVIKSQNQVTSLGTVNIPIDGK
jgi:cysteine-rich repeat protein